MGTTGNTSHVRVKAVKVILYSDDGKKLIYKLGDPKGDRELGVQIEVEQEYDECDMLLDSSKIFKTRAPTYTFKVT